MSGSETSGQLNPGSKAYLYSYLQNTDWYKARLQSLSGPLASSGAPAQDRPQPSQQSPKNQERPRITGQIANVDQENRSFSIRTERGDLTLKPPRTAPLPPEGLRIEIALPRNKEGAPPREGQNISFRPLPQNSQPAPIRQTITDAAPSTPPQQGGNIAPPSPDNGFRPVPPFKPATPLVDTPSPQQADHKRLLPTAPQNLESGAVIIVRAMSEAQIQAIRPLPPPTPEQAAPSVPPQQNTTTAKMESPAPPMPPNMPPTTPITENAAEQTTRPATAPSQIPAIQPALTAFFTNTEKAAVILRGTTPQTTGSAPAINLGPATLDAASDLTGITPKTTPLPDTTVKPPPQTMATLSTTPENLLPAPTAATANGQVSARQSSAVPQAIKIEAVSLISVLPQATSPQKNPQVSTQANATPPFTGEPQPPAETKNAARPDPAIRQGEIVGQTENGRPVMAVRNEADTTTSAINKASESAPIRYFALDMPATNVTQGTQVSFTETTPPQNIQPTIPQAAAMAAQAQNITFSSHATWPAMDDIAQTLQMAAPQQAQALMNQSPNVQSPAMKMEPAILFFLAAARSGDISGWLGSQSTEALRQAGKSDTLNRLMNDFRTLSRPSQESGSPVQNAPEWRSMPLPLFAYNEAHKIMLHYKYDGGAQQNDGESDKSAMRFVIDLEMTKMGDVQLDGFAQKERLDLIVRTRQPLSPEMQQIMRRKYSSSLEDTGFHGDLGFHGNPDKFIKIEPAQTADQSGINV